VPRCGVGGQEGDTRQSIPRSEGGGSARDFVERAIPEYAELQVGVTNSRVRYLVEDLGFLESSFLVWEGLL
jgi:hypothetical protein